MYMEVKEVIEGLSVHVFMLHVECASRVHARTCAYMHFHTLPHTKYIEYGLQRGRRLLSVHASISLDGPTCAVHPSTKVSHVKMRMCMCVCVLSSQNVCKCM